jgi:hypothetical protein
LAQSKDEACQTLEHILIKDSGWKDEDCSFTCEQVVKGSIGEKDKRFSSSSGSVDYQGFFSDALAQHLYTTLDGFPLVLMQRLRVLRTKKRHLDSTH